MFNSYIEFTAFGTHADEFVDYLVKSEFQIRNVTSNTDIYTIRTSPANYKAITQAARLYRVKTKVVFRSGAYFTLRKYRRRLGIPLGLILFFAIIVTLSNYVWSIEISGNENIGDYQIKEQLEKSNIKPGAHVNDINKNKAELEMQLVINGIAWVSIERVGSRINVKISETTEFTEQSQSEEEIDINTPCNIIANRTGQLIKAEVYRGRLLYEVSSGISAGDVIVSGIVDNGAGVWERIHADALLIAEVIEVKDFYQPYTTLCRAKNGRSVSSTSVLFLGRRFGKEPQIDKYAEHVDYSESFTKPKIFGFPLPVRILEQNYVFSDRVEVTDTAVEAREKLLRQIELYETNFLSDAEIIERQTDFFPDDNGIGAVTRYVYRADVAEKALIGD